MKAFWERFILHDMQQVQRLRGRKRDAERQCAGVMRLSPDAQENDLLLEEILLGRRTAYVDTLSHLQQLDREIMQSRQHFILTDSAGQPRCVIHTTGAHFFNFRDMREEWVQMEGVDATLTAWKTRWRAILMQDAQAMGLPLSLDEMMVAETFTVVYQEEAREER
ncbi:MAG: ASCH domain-containing protein [Clostridia bacterium]|nr:ASCH domain-containing protein [Clostridia bacterium]